MYNSVGTNSLLRILGNIHVTCHVINLQNNVDATRGKSSKIYSNKIRFHRDFKVIFKAEFIKILEYSIYVNECWIIFTVLHSGLSLFRWKIVEIKVSGNFPTWRRDARMFINNLCFPSKSGSSDGFPQVEI